MRGRGRPGIKHFSDRVSEMVYTEQRTRLARQFMSMNAISPSAELSNGIAERASKSLLDLTRSLLKRRRIADGILGRGVRDGD